MRDIIEQQKIKLKKLENFNFFLSARLLARVTGKIILLFSARFGSLSRFMRRQMHLSIY